MRSLNLLFLAIVIGMKSFSQQTLKVTKAETQDWIKEKVESFSYSYDNYKGYFGTRNFKISFTDCNTKIIMVDENYNHGFESKLTQVAIIPIKDLSKLYFQDVSSDVISIIFRSKTENSIKLTYNDKPSESVSFVEFRFKKNSLKDNLQERLIKAFNNLIEICGGKITKEVF